jgi:thiosulfate/3-mercaptopyruvate sulfurtransferase
LSYANPAYLIEPADLESRLARGEVRVFDATVFLERAEVGYRAVSGQASYDEEHIPQAAFLDQVSALSDSTSDLGFTLPEAAPLQSAFAAAGVDAGIGVVFYSTSHMMWATRAWWLAHYAGHDDVAVLNGGLAAWRGAGKPVSTDNVEFPAGEFSAEPRSAVFTDKTAVLGAIGEAGICTVNALAPQVYTGEAAMDYGRKGHITGSINLFYDELLDEGRFRPAAELEHILAANGLLEADQVIAYCGGGISATIDAFACLLVGKTEVTVYDGSMREWTGDSSLPMTTGSKPGQGTSS